MAEILATERRAMDTPQERRYAETEARWRARAAEREEHDRRLRTTSRLEVDTPARTRSRLLRVLRAEPPTNASPAIVSALIGDLIPPPARVVGELDPSLERILDHNDLVDITYLERGLRVARAVGRVVIGGNGGQPVGYGSGTLVSPQLFLTNNHVLPDARVAARSSVQFGFQRGLDGDVLNGARFPCDPDTFFLTSTALDFTLVAVRARAGDLAAFGWNPLIEAEGKVILGESVSIVQHPGGEPKQLALRENQVIDLLDDFLHYRTDTAPGSSGSPVFNDQWEVVALHHSGVPRRDDQGRLLARDGTLWTPAMGEQRIDWLGNEGIRISRIVKHLRAQTLAEAPARLRDDLLRAQELLRQVAPLPGGREARAHPSGDGQNGAWTPSRPEGVATGGGAVTLTIPPGVVIRCEHIPAGTVAALAAGVAPQRGPAEAFETRISPDALQVGDVLLYRGTSPISRGIRLFDGTDYSHAGLYVGGGRVIEALGEGVVARDLGTSIAGAEWVSVRRLAAGPQDLEPVRLRGEFYLDQGNRYAYEQIVLLAILILVRKVAPNPALAWLVRNAVSLATSALTRLLADGKQPMICSELVYRAYDEALPAGDDSLGLQIPGFPLEATRAAGRRAIELGGDGVHPESLLAWASRAPSPLRAIDRVDPAVGAEAAVAFDAASRHQELEESLARYIETARAGRLLAPVPPVGEEDVRAEIARFTNRIAAAGLLPAPDRAVGGNGGGGLRPAPAERFPLPGSFGVFFQTAADFVTPGDLAKTRSLLTLGEIDTGHLDR